MKSFIQFYEASQSDIELIQPHVKNVGARPFDELFRNRDRFIVTVPAERLSKILKRNKIRLDNIDQFYQKGGIKKLFTEYPHLSVQEKAIIKQSINQRTTHMCLLFSRHPIDVLRMADFGKIKSCHSLDGSLRRCAFSNAQNNGGIVFLITPSDANKIKNHLNEQDILYDEQRKVGYIIPQGRIRLRNFVDLKTDYSFAIPVMLNATAKYHEYNPNAYNFPLFYENRVLEYCRQHQRIYSMHPSVYELKDVVMLGGENSDVPINVMLSVFFGIEVRTVNYNRIFKQGIELHNIQIKEDRLGMHVSASIPLSDKTITNDNVRRRVHLLNFIKYSMLAGHAQGYIEHITVENGVLHLSFVVNARDIDFNLIKKMGVQYIRRNFSLTAELTKYID